MKKSSIEWQLDLKPVRRAPKPAPVKAALEPTTPAIPAALPVAEAAPPAISVEILEMLNDLRRKVDNLNARLRIAEQALEQAAVPAPEIPKIPAATAKRPQRIRRTAAPAEPSLEAAEA